MGYIYHTSLARISSAEICRQNGWQPGTILQAERLPKEEPAPPVEVVITAVGQTEILAVARHDPLHEFQLQLYTRDWRPQSNIRVFPQQEFSHAP